MAILPKFLYFFRVLPISIPAHFFMNHTRENNTVNFGKGKTKLRGGLCFPNFATYYKAAQLAHLSKYHATKETPLWVVIEAVDCDPFSISNLLWLRPVAHAALIHPIPKHSLSVWDRHKTTYRLQSTHNPLLSFLRNPAFYPAWESPGPQPDSSAYTTWSRRHCFYHFQTYVSPLGLPNLKYYAIYK